jgi:hypothetical protein
MLETSFMSFSLPESLTVKHACVFRYAEEVKSKLGVIYDGFARALHFLKLVHHFIHQHITTSQLNQTHNIEERSVSTMGVKGLERSLGFRDGLGHLAIGKLDTSAIKALYLAVEDIKRKYSRHSVDKLQVSRRFKDEVEGLFTRLGPELWPRVRALDTAAWLVNARESDADGHWLRDLTYDGDKAA